MDTQVPILYMDFPLGRFKFQGAIVYPNNKYMVLRLGSTRHIQCEDVFEHIVRHLKALLSHLCLFPLSQPLALPQSAII
jgi:hypothetical protein